MAWRGARQRAGLANRVKQRGEGERGKAGEQVSVCAADYVGQAACSKRSVCLYAVHPCAPVCL